MGKHSAPSKNKHLKPREPKEIRLPDLSRFASDRVRVRLLALSARLREHGVRRSRAKVEFNRKNVALAVLSLAVFAGVWLYYPTGWLYYALYLVPMVLAGLPLFISAIEDAIQGQILGRDLCYSLAALLAFVSGYCSGAALLTVLVRCSDTLMAWVEHRCGRELESIDQLSSRQVKLLDNEAPELVNITLVPPGAVIEVDKDERIPLDGCVLSGSSTVDLSPLSGDRLLMPVAEGSEVPAGGINMTSSLRLRVLRGAENSLTFRLAQAARTAFDEPTPPEKQLTKLSTFFSAAMGVAAVLLTVLPPFLGGDWRFWMSRASILLLLSRSDLLLRLMRCGYQASLGKAFSHGILFKNQNAMERFSRTETMVFNKTGTVTEGRYLITGVYPEGVDEEELIYLAASAEKLSRHPMARAILESCLRELPADEDVLEMEEISGQGVSAFVNRRQYYVGSASLMADHNIHFTVPVRPGAAVHVAVDGQYKGHILVADKIRDNAFDAIEELRQCGVKTHVLLTGDVHSVARSIASSLNFDLVKSELTPQAKVNAVEYLMATRNNDTTLAFVGNGNRDEEALRRAEVGLVISGCRAPRTVEDCDIAVLGEDIRKFPLAMRLSRENASIVRQDRMVFLLARIPLVILSLCSAFGVQLSALLAAAVSLACIGNTLRIPLSIPFTKKKKRRK